ncbi:MAG: DUF2490 domain-containing protein [Bacteroidota bacterium]
MIRSKSLLKILIILSISLLAYNAYTQEARSLWSGAELQLPFSKAFRVTLSPELRLTDEKRIDDFILEADAQLRIHKLLQPTISYRYYRFYDDPGEYFNGQRLGLGVNSSAEFGRFKLTNRLYYFHRLINRYGYGYSIETRREIREGLKLSYNIPRSKLEPFVQTEIYFDLSPDRNHEFSKIRVRTGLGYPFNKRSSIDLFFQVQDKLNTNNPLRTYTIGVFYNYKLPTPKPKPVDIE